MHLTCTLIYTLNGNHNLTNTLIIPLPDPIWASFKLLNPRDALDFIKFEVICYSLFRLLSDKGSYIKDVHKIYQFVLDFDVA